MLGDRSRKATGTLVAYGQEGTMVRRDKRTDDRPVFVTEETFDTVGPRTATGNWGRSESAEEAIGAADLSVRFPES